MWSIDATKILTEREIAAVLADLRRRRQRSINSHQNLIVFRLSTCCGLRVSEICGLRLSDVHVGIERPYVHVRRQRNEHGERKPKRSSIRRIALWWDGGTLADMAAWKDLRQGQGAKPGDVFVCSQAVSSHGRPLDRPNAAARFRTACRTLGPDRLESLSIHTGRHTFVSHALRYRTLAEVQQAAGHSSIQTTSIYTHVAVDDDGAVGNIFGIGGDAAQVG